MESAHTIAAVLCPALGFVAGGAALVKILPVAPLAYVAGQGPPNVQAAITYILAGIAIGGLLGGAGLLLQIARESGRHPR